MIEHTKLSSKVLITMAQEELLDLFKQMKESMQMAVQTTEVKYSGLLMFVTGLIGLSSTLNLFCSTIA